jgi:very-short-patch-repair endonuclease
MTEYFNRTAQRTTRQELRNNMPPAEVLLWSRLRGRQVLNCRFRRQYGVGPYVLDFYTTEVKLGVELDGESHFTAGASAYDKERQEYIESFGIKVLRFLNPGVYDNLDGVLEAIAEQVRVRRGATSPPPAPPSQGGEKSGASQGGE